MEEKKEKLDSIDYFLRHSNSLYTKLTRKPDDLSLKKEELDILRKVRQNYFASDGFDEYSDYIEFFTKNVQELPVSAAGARKNQRSISKWDRKKILKMVDSAALKRSSVGKRPKYYSIWTRQGTRASSSTPKLGLPGNSESYNPPKEYVENDQNLEVRPCLRNIPIYKSFIQERFSRCLDLYLCPRAKKPVPPTEAYPVSTDLSTYKPYPSNISFEFKGHEGRIVSMSVNLSGEYLISADSTSLILWELENGKRLDSWQLGNVRSVKWCPNGDLCFIAASEYNLFIIFPFSKESIGSCRLVGGSPLSWELVDGKENIYIRHDSPIYFCDWHASGKYFVSLAGEPSQAIYIHNSQKKHSFSLFKKPQTGVKKVCFHPTQPIIIILFEKHIKTYDLVTHKAVKKITHGLQSVTCFDMHASGKYLLLGSAGKKICCLHLDAEKVPAPLKVFSSAITDVAFHKSFPQFAVCTDDGSLSVFHYSFGSDGKLSVLPLHIFKVDCANRLCFHTKNTWLLCSVNERVLLFS